MTLSRDYLTADALYRAAITTNARHGPISQPPRRNWSAVIVALAIVGVLIIIALGGGHD